ncbi:Mut7-C RNAse domain-containing protein [Salinactinospora qingdaonensis]|uniref:Mut7-C RNAse domain-containing protein n=1 Tax=Salinactinospora qingdaonensis TaxID=702744 RepID=A0ABP7GHX7_9ACTN
MRFAAELWFLLPPRHRHPEAHLRYDGTSSLGHVIESNGVPLPEVGRLEVNATPVAASHRPAAGDLVTVLGVPRPQKVPFSPLKFLLDVHLGALARRLRLVGVDAAYHNDRDDPALVEQANAEERVLLTQDRRLLHRRNLRAGGYVRGSDPDRQLHDVLERFAPPLAPWSRCTACNGTLAPVHKDEVKDLLEPGTRATYDTFAQCQACGRLYWPGAHHRRLTAIVAAAEETVAAAATPEPRQA